MMQTEELPALSEPSFKVSPDRGYLYERIAHSPLERELAERWEREAPKLIHMIVNRHVTPKERYVAASVIQWLGTNVGITFLVEALRKAGYSLCFPEVRKYYSYQSDEFLKALQNHQLQAEYEAAIARQADEIAQLYFDLAEPS